MVITPAWTRCGTAFRHTWEGLVNVDQFRWMVRRDMQQQLKMAHDELKARHVRAVGMFDDEMRVMGLSPAGFRDPSQRGPRLNWQVVDYVIDSLLDIGINPMFTTSFVPSAMASGTRTCFSTRSQISPPKDYGHWADLVGQAVGHAIDRYGIKVVRQWYFEVWNEPNLNSFWDGTREQFHRLWSTTYRAIKDVDAELRVGGPSTARAEWIGELLEFGGKNNCVPDYIIAHIYNNDSASSPLSPFEGPQEHKENTSPHFASGVVRGVRNLLDQLSFRGEVHWNEWGRSWWPCFPERETATEAAWLAKTMAEVSQQGDYFAYWCLSDIYDQVGYGAETFHGNYGMLNLQGLRKPAYHAFQLLSMLGEERLETEVQSATPTSGCIVTRNDQGVQILVYGETREKITLQLPPEALPRRAKLYRVTADENSILKLWAEMGSPAYLTREQAAALHGRNALARSPADQVLMEQGGHPHVSFELPGPGVALIELTMAGVPMRPNRLGSEDLLAAGSLASGRRQV